MRISLIGALLSVIALAGCAASRILPEQPRPAALARAAAPCPTAPPPGRAHVAKLGLRDANLLFTMGEPATVPLQVRLFNQNGKIPKGVYAHPIVVSVADDSPSKPHVTISCHEIYSSYQAFPTIRFDGHGDTIVL
ncbi:MAG TPA: hypothetical protein VKB39_03420, partial [Candidatus Baltobacteraceae bacterium]|nr:hypothetical protein [Candidatus Baltobacteraceae bacterium]